MENSNTLTLTLQFKEDGSIIVEQAKGKIKDLGKSTDDITRAFSSFNSKTEDTRSTLQKLNTFLKETRTKYQELGVGIGIVGGAIYGAIRMIKKGIDEVEFGAKLQQIQESFDLVARSARISRDEIIRDIKEAGHVFIADTEIMLKAQQGLIQGLSKEQVVGLTQAARVAARYMGTGVGDAFQRIMGSISTLQTKTLTPAFVIDVDEAMKKYAKSVGTTTEALTELERIQALTNAVLDESKRKLDALGGALYPTTYEKVQRFKSGISEMRETISKEITKRVEQDISILSTFLAILDRIETHPASKGFFGMAPSQYGEFYKRELEKMGVGAYLPPSTWPSESRFIDLYKSASKAVPKIRENEEAVKAVAAALEKAAAAEVQLNAMFPDDAYNLKMMANEAERAKTAIEIMKGLGIKTTRGAEAEIDQVTEKLRILIGGGFKGEDLTAARKKLEEELNAIQQSYSSFTTGMKEQAGHWEEIPVVIGKRISGLSVKNVWGTDWRWVQDISVQTVTAQDKLFETVERKTKAASEELKRMQDQVEATGESGAKLQIIRNEIGEIVSVSDGAATQIKKTFDEATGAVSYSFRTMSDNVKQKIQDINLQLGTIRSVYEGIREEMLKPIKVEVDFVNRQSPEKSVTDKLNEIQARLFELGGIAIPVVMNITGTGSTQRPIMEKIEEIYSGFESMAGYMTRLKFNLELSSINAQIAQIQSNIANAYPSMNRYLTSGYYGVLQQRRYESLSQLEDYRSIFLEAQRTWEASQATAATPAYAAPSYGSGDVSISIGTVVVQQAEDERMAETLDRELAELWRTNRSRLRVAIGL